MPNRVRYTLISPSLHIHERALKLFPEHGRVFVDNRKRLSLSAEIDDQRSIDKLRRLGVEVVSDTAFDLDDTDVMRANDSKNTG